MTIGYTLDASQSTILGLLKVLFRWRGSVWKAVFVEMATWTVAYLAIHFIYAYAVNRDSQIIFGALVRYLDENLDKYIPLSFLLGFFITQVITRWQGMIGHIGWIDTAAINFANLIKGTDEETRILRRTLVRYMVLTQALILRDISLQVRNRLPTSECLVAAGFATAEELDALHSVEDGYTRYWLPIHWCHALLVQAHEAGKITSYYTLDFILKEIQVFRQGLLAMLRYDWIPIPLVYPQVVFLSVRVYFMICLVGRQHIVHEEVAEGDFLINPVVPVKTLVEFFVYYGWMKVAEALLNPLGEDDDDLEANCVIDQNLIAGLALVDQANRPPPPLVADKFGDDISPLYSLDAAARTVHPLLGSAKALNVVREKSTVTMVPHKSRLTAMSDAQQQLSIKRVSVRGHNQRDAEFLLQSRTADPDRALKRIQVLIGKDIPKSEKQRSAATTTDNSV